MVVAIQLISSHPVLIHALRKINFCRDGFSFRIMPLTLGEPPDPRGVNALWFFLLDACSLRIDLSSLVTRCRCSFPGSKFLALLPPAVGNFAEKIRLFCWGMDGFVDLHETWHAELPRAVDTILQGQLWVSREILELFTSHEKTLLEKHLLPGHSLTARERQVLQLLMRGLSNKDICSLIDIAERTVKFHVSNILTKLQLEDRRRLLPERLRQSAAAARA